jgi:hypothetical protein
MYIEASQPASQLSAARFAWDRAQERQAVELLVRFAWNGLRGTAMLKDLTRFGARIEGITALRKGDWLTLLMPGLPATDAMVAWTAGSTAGLAFADPLDEQGHGDLIANFAVSIAAQSRRAA